MYWVVTNDHEVVNLAHVVSLTPRITAYRDKWVIEVLLVNGRKATIPGFYLNPSEAVEAAKDLVTESYVSMIKETIRTTAEMSR